MYCPSCHQNFSATYSRCPECHCWLKPSEKPVGVASPAGKKDGNKSEWLNGGETDDWGWSGSQEKTPKATKPETSGWLQPAEEEYGWNASGPVESKLDSEKEYGWSHDAPADEVAEVDDAWVDEEFDGHLDDLDTYYSQDDAATLQVQMAQPTDTPVRLILGLVGLLFLVAVLFTVDRQRSNVPDPTETARKEASQSAEIWLASARESARKDSFEDAVLQYDKALQFMAEAEADPVEIIRAQVEYADSLRSTGDFLAAHEQLYAVAPQIEDGEQRLAAVEYEIRKKAATQLEQAKKLRDSKPREALRLAEESAEIYEAFDGSNQQMAGAYDVIADVYLKQDEVTAAAEAVKNALRWETSPKRLQLYARLFPSAPPPPSKPQRIQRVTVQASIGNGNDIPEGTHTGGHHSSPKVNQPVVIVDKPKPKPPEHKPNYAKFKQQDQERLGKNPLTDTAPRR
ncbi:MAG: hypothetical protein KC800_00550 [Candidatus Eremiobacteraeota bacterium]|nr:hypothetical protein [Candidatus Eremiobacteraeota bacterium]